MDQGKLENAKVEIKNAVKGYARLVAEDIAELHADVMSQASRLSYQVEQEDEELSWAKLKEKYAAPEFAAVILDVQQLLDTVDAKQTEIIKARDSQLAAIVEYYFRPEEKAPEPLQPEVYE